MIPDKKGYEEYLKFQDEILEFLNEQVERLPSTWTERDQFWLVLYVALKGAEQFGATKEDIKQEVQSTLSLIFKKGLN